MPNIIFGAQQRRHDVISMNNKTYSYEYPDELKLKPGTELHSKLVNLILDKSAASAGIMSSRHSGWNEMDKSLTAYKRVDDDESEVLEGDDRKPVSIVFPYSYAILETLLSYMMAAFFRNPIFKYEGSGPEDVMGSILLEKVIATHCHKNKVMLNLHTMFRDAFAYGVGSVAPIWKYGKRNEGNALLNLDPYRILPDTNVAADKIQDGEFYGWTADTNYMSLLQEEYEDDSMFNVKYLGDLQYRGTSIYDVDKSGRYIRTGMPKNYSDMVSPITEIIQYIKLIPKDYNLSDYDRPETWFFRLAADSVIISARPANFNHNKYPVSCAVPDFDGYSASPIGRLEILSGMQGVLDWLFNSHIANVRKAINDTLIYDPSLINSNDLRDPKPGGLIRMRRQAWGQGRIADAVHQLKVSDITRGNVADSGWIIQSMQTLMGTDDAAMGSLRQGGPERLTKAEFQGTSSGAVSRLERIARVTGLQAMQDIGEFFAEHTQQIMDKDTYIKVVGGWQEVLMQEYKDSIDRGRMAVTPDDLNINYDVLVRDGSIPGGNYSEVWTRMFETLATQPELAQKFDIVKIFKHIARNAGAKNVNEFIRRGGDIASETMPNEDVSKEVDKGNLIPINQGATG